MEENGKGWWGGGGGGGEGRKSILELMETDWQQFKMILEVVYDLLSIICIILRKFEEVKIMQKFRIWTKDEN